MATTSTTSLSRSDNPQQQPKPSNLDSFPPDVNHAPKPLDRNGSPSTIGCKVERLHIKVDDGPDGKVPGFLHLPAPYHKGSHNPTAAILLSGAGGGVVGPSSIYLSIADKLASIPSNQDAMLALRLDYRYPARNKYCLSDVQAAVDFLEREHGVSKVVLVGWSFGGAPVFTFGGMDQRCIAAATVASQTAETEGIRRMPPRPVLLLHGKADRTLSASCSERLKAMYESGDRGGKGDVKVRLFEGDDHALTRSAGEADRFLCQFIMRRAGVTMDEKVVQTAHTPLVAESREEKVELMRKGGDLRGAESVE